MELGGNLGPETNFRCAFEPSKAAVCVNGKISGAAKLNGWPCVVNQNLKLDADAGDQAAKYYAQKKAECEAKGPPWQWSKTGNRCIQG
jgi:hypothetical protein